MLKGRFGIAIAIFNVIALLVLLSPIAVVVTSSFGDTFYMKFPPSGFTFRWYAEALAEDSYHRAFYTSIYIGFISAAIATAVGALGAWSLSRNDIRGGDWIGSAALLPLTLPSLVLGIGILTVTQPLNMASSLMRLILAHAIISVPYVIRILQPVISALRVELEESASNLGARPWVVVWTITLPLLMPALVTSYIVCFIVSFDELILALFLAPSSSRTIPMEMLSKLEWGLDPSIAAISAMLIAATAIIVAIIEFVLKTGRIYRGNA